MQLYAQHTRIFKWLEVSSLQPVQVGPLNEPKKIVLEKLKEIKKHKFFEMLLMCSYATIDAHYSWLS